MAIYEFLTAFRLQDVHLLQLIEYHMRRLFHQKNPVLQTDDYRSQILMIPFRKTNLSNRQSHCYLSNLKFVRIVEIKILSSNLDITEQCFKRPKRKYFLHLFQCAIFDTLCPIFIFQHLIILLIHLLSFIL